MKPHHCWRVGSRRRLGWAAPRPPSPTGCSGRAAAPLGTAQLVAVGMARGSQQKGELCPPNAQRWRHDPRMTYPRDLALAPRVEVMGAM